MLIRLAGHHINNPNHIDKLISIKGLPEEWIFRPSRFGGKELVPPWIPDIEANIPKSIRHLCEPTEVTFSYPPIEKGRESVVDKKTILGLKFDYMTEPGHELWEKIERYLDTMTPRDQKVPAPVIVAPNQKSEFNPHRARRTVRGSLEFDPCEIPEVDLRTNSKSTITQVSVTPTIEEPQKRKRRREPDGNFKCETCQKEFTRMQALRMHKTIKHREKSPVETPMAETVAEPVAIGG